MAELDARSRAGALVSSPPVPPNNQAAQSSKGTFHSLMKVPAAADSILDHSALPAITAVGFTCKTNRDYTKQYLLRRIDQLLGAWVQAPEDLRGMMEETCSVLSGSTVLAFILGADWGTNDLDLYAPLGGECERLAVYLIEREGYQVAEAFRGEGIEERGYNPARIKTVYKLSKTINIPGREPITRHIDVIESMVDHSIRPVLCFHTTIVMNWITSNGIFVAYPRLTFAMKGILNERIDMTKPRHMTWMEKYQNRGFSILTHTKDLGHSCGAACPTIWRSTLDVGCMAVPFDGALTEYEEARWTLIAGHVPLIICKNPLCSRSKVLLERRDGQPLAECDEGRLGDAGIIPLNLEQLSIADD